MHCPFPSHNVPNGQVEKQVPLLQTRHEPGPPQTSQMPFTGLQVSQRCWRSHGAGRHASPQTLALGQQVLSSMHLPSGQLSAVQAHWSLPMQIVPNGQVEKQVPWLQTRQ